MLSQKLFNYIYKHVPRLNVDLIFLKNNKILWTRRKISPYKGKWHLPGGTVLLHEELQEAVTRIAKKELGIDVDTMIKVGIIEFLKEGKGRHAVSIVYLIKSPNKTILLDKSADSFSFLKVPPSNCILEHKKFVLKEYKNDLG